MDTAAELEAIRRLKYAYFDTSTSSSFDDLGALFTEDVTAAYEDGRTVLEGRAPSSPGSKVGSWATRAWWTEHHGHHPGETFTSDTSAEGTWYLQDRVIIPAAELEIA